MPKGGIPLSHQVAQQTALSGLLLSSFLLLPRLGSSSPVQTTSADRPEHPFLTPLTANAGKTMMWAAFGTAASMAAWGHVLSLRNTSPAKETSKAKAAGTAEAEAPAPAAAAAGGQKRKGQRIREAAMATEIGAGVMMLFLLLLGAPFDQKLLETALLAFHLSALLVWPVVHALGIPSMYQPGVYERYRLTKLFSEFSPESAFERTLVYPVIGTLCGAWLGAAPLPLDWDRPWQSWPLTPAFGATLGFIVGNWTAVFTSIPTRTKKALPRR